MKEKYDNKPEFVKYPKILYLEEHKSTLGKEGYFFEKIDGALCQVRNTDQGLLGGSKSGYITGKKANTTWFPKFLKWMHSNGSLYNLRKDVIMFGEWLSPTTIEYDKKNLDKFYFIDLVFVENNKPKFFDYEEAVNYLDLWGVREIEISPVLDKGKFTKEKIEKLREKESYLRKGNKEGLVLKDYWSQDFTKSLNPEYSEIRGQEKTLEGKYVNGPRVNKALSRLKDNGIKNPSLESLASEVSKDVNNEAKIRFDIRAIKGIIRIKDLYREKKGKFY